MFALPVDQRLNRILRRLPREELQRVCADMREIELAQGTLLYEWQSHTADVLFPTTLIVSMITLMEDGQSVESMLVGNDGLVGAWTAAGVRGSPWRAVVQSGGHAYAIDADAFTDHLGTSPALQRLSLRYAVAGHFVTSQSVGCNRFHDLNSRAARWLLTVADRTGNREVHFTQEFLSQMLGAHRPSVTVALGTLERLGSISRRRRGVIELVDRERLEDIACECYPKVRDYVDRATNLGVPM